ncbi:MAG: DEAD/DEAH box helicase [Breznakibacter sp.]
MTFAELNLSNQLLNALTDLGFTTPTTIQAKAFSPIMSGKDVLGIAQTGTGKTIAFLLPCLRQWKFSKEKFPQIVVLVPTRELVVQVVEVVRQLTRYMNVEVGGVYGGANINTQALMVQNGLDVLVGTPGRLLDLILNGALRTRNVKRLVIDEVDEMLDLGFRHQLTSIFDLMPAKRQNLLFSATLRDEVTELIDTFFNHPVRIEAAPAGTPLANIGQRAYRIPNFHTKINLLELLLKTHPDMSKVLVFVGTRQLADDLYDEMGKRFPGQIGVIHSRKLQNFRFRAVEQYQKGEIRVLIATDLIARGIDILDVTHVVNFDTPDDAESYIHRIGRTGRADRKGVALSFFTELDADKVAAIEELMGMQVPMVELPDALIVSDRFLPIDMPKVDMKNQLVKTPSLKEGSGAFHERAEHNKKVNQKITRAEAMMKKYGKPQTRGQKRK